MKNLKRRIAAMLSLTLVLAIIPLPSFAAPSPVAAPAAIAPAAIPFVDLKCVTFVNASIGYAAGANGTIIKTIDGGENWTQLTTGTSTADFRGIVFWSESTGSAVTYDRATYKTIDGGTTWTLVNADFTAAQAGTPAIGVNAATAIPSASPGLAMLAGGDTNPADDAQDPAQGWRTGTYGAYWGNAPKVADARHPELAGDETIYVGEGEFLGVDFSDDMHGWVVGDDLYNATSAAPIWVTADGGLGWTAQTFTPALRLTGVSFASNTLGVTVSNEGRIFRTSDGGTNWVEATVVPAPLTALRAVGMIDTSIGWAVGAGGTLLRTADGGAVWASATSPAFSNLAAVTFVGSHGVAVGASGTVIVTDDGITWHAAGDGGGGGDITPPTMTSLSSATHLVEATWYSQANAGFTWAASDAVGVTGYSYVLDSTSNTTPDTTSEGSATTTSVVAPEGLLYFHVRAVDAAGNWSTASHRAVRTDRTKPTTNGNHAASYSGTANITLTPVDQPLLSGIQKTEWSLNGAALQSGTSVVVSTLGAYTLTYASTDNAGNRETTQTANFTVIDATPPTMTTLTSSSHSVAATWYSQGSASFTWGATDASGVVGYSYALDSALSTTPDTVSEGSATATSVAVPEGLRYFHVRAVDAAGNWSTPLHRAVRTDRTKPTTTDNHVAAYTGTAVITLTPTDADAGVATTYYSLDGTPGTGTTVLVSAEGAHTLDYASVDNAGNRETTVTIGFTIDLTGPSLASLGSETHPSSSTWYANNDLTFAWSATDPGGVAGYSYALDQTADTMPGETSEGTGTSTTYSNRADGIWYFHIRAVDSLGNWSGASRIQVKIDTTKPTTTDNHVASYTGPASITLTPTDADAGVATTYYSLDGTPGTGTTVLATSEGVHTLDYASVDNAGNREATVTIGFTIDSSAPMITSLTSSTHPSSSTWYANNDPAFAWTATDTHSSVAGYSYALDQTADTTPGETSQGTDTSTTYSNRADGIWFFHIRAVDSLGKWSGASHIQVKIDTATPTEVPAIPVEGTSRYLTAIEASKLAFPGGAPTVIIATGTNWPDALGGAALAGEVGGPILLTDPNTLPSAVRAEITRLGATKAYILGSEAAVSNAVEAAVEGMSGVTVRRLKGSNRYATARAIAEEVVNLPGRDTGRTFFVATGTNFPDALAASPLAASKGWPLFLVGATGLSASDLAYMKANGDSAIILGSTGAVAASVQKQLNTTFGNEKVKRLEGGDRYSTGLAIVTYATSSAGGLTWATPAVATGTNFPDALSGGVLQGLDGSILLLTNGTTLTPSVRAAITTHEAEITEVRYLGSTSAVSVAVRNAIQAIVN